MLILFALIVLVVFFGSVLADYKWNRWIVERRAEREAQHPMHP